MEALIPFSFLKCFAIVEDLQLVLEELLWSTLLTVQSFLKGSILLKKRIGLGLPAVGDEVADHLVSVLLGVSQQLFCDAEVSSLAHRSKGRLTLCNLVLLRFEFEDMSREMIMNKLQHPLALGLQEPIIIGGAVIAAARHRLILAPVCGQGRLTACKDLLVKVIQPVKLHEQFRLIKECLCLRGAEPEATSNPLHGLLTLLKQRVGVLAKRIVSPQHLTLLKQHQVLEIFLELCIKIFVF